MPKSTIKLLLISITLAIAMMSITVKIFLMQVETITTQFISDLSIQNTQEIIVDPQLVKPKPKPVKEPTKKEKIDSYIEKVCKTYKVDPTLIKSMVYHESRYNPNASTGICLGLMQINPYWHKSRMSRLHVTNLFNPYDNVLVGVDFISDLLKKYKDPELVLMLYNMKWDTAFTLHSEGKATVYAKSVMSRSRELKRESKYHYKEATK